jgi:hypothetical protein
MKVGMITDNNNDDFILNYALRIFGRGGKFISLNSCYVINSPHGLDGACIKEQFVLLEIEKGLVYSTLILFCKCKLGCWNLMLDVECDFKTC